MTLREKQARFTSLVPLLITYAIARGFEPVIAEVQRTISQALANANAGTGIANSLHIDKLAIDLLLFRNGVFLTTTAAHAPLGAFWKSLDPMCRWGGDFSRPDGNHYSYSIDGIRA